MQSPLLTILSIKLYRNYLGWNWTKYSTNGTTEDQVIIMPKPNHERDRDRQTGQSVRSV